VLALFEDRLVRLRDMSLVAEDDTSTVFSIISHIKSSLKVKGHKVGAGPLDVGAGVVSRIQQSGRA